MNESKSPAPPISSTGGLHISRGVTLRIPAGGLMMRIGEDGTLSAELTTLHVQLNTCTDWLEIAVDHLNAAGAAHDELIATQRAGRDFGELLRREFKSGMQAVVAAATFFEALHAATRERLPSSRNAPCATGKQQAARSAYVTEQLKRAFSLKTHGTKNLRSVLTEIYRFRDKAVHPSAEFEPPEIHPDIGIAVERRFIMFGYSNARLLVRAALAYCKILPSRDISKLPKEIRELARYLLTTGEPLFQAWEAQYGPLLDEPIKQTP